MVFKGQGLSVNLGQSSWHSSVTGPTTHSHSRCSSRRTWSLGAVCLLFTICTHHNMSGKFCFAIDRGGTFTDVWARCPDGSTTVLKLLSEDPANYPDAPREGIRRILEQVRWGVNPEMQCLYLGAEPPKLNNPAAVTLGMWLTNSINYSNAISWK